MATLLAEKMFTGYDSPLFKAAYSHSIFLSVLLTLVRHF